MSDFVTVNLVVGFTCQLGLLPLWIQHVQSKDDGGGKFELGWLLIMLQVIN